MYKRISQNEILLIQKLGWYKFQIYINSFKNGVQISFKVSNKNVHLTKVKYVCCKAKKLKKVLLIEKYLTWTTEKIISPMRGICHIYQIFSVAFFIGNSQRKRKQEIPNTDGNIA